MVRFIQKISQKSTFLLLVVSPFAVAQADVGAIGSPVQLGASGNYASDGANNKENAVITAANNSNQLSSGVEIKASLATEKEFDSKDAVMIIRFNQKYVYFKTALKKVVYKVAGSKPDAIYEVTSSVPSNKKSPADTDYYETNLKNVVAVLNRLGVPANKINSSVVTSDSVQSQEISISIR